MRNYSKLLYLFSLWPLATAALVSPQNRHTAHRAGIDTPWSLQRSLAKAESATRTSVKLIDAFPALRFARPVFVTQLPDGSKRMAVVQQGGRIVVFPKQASTSKVETLLDISERVGSAGGEEGLLGLAFDPDYQRNKFYYVNYTKQSPRRTVIARFKGNDPKSEKVILEIAQPYSNHNGGALAFGPDGFLYIATGDGGAANDPHAHGQNLASLLGKILRIDPRSGNPYKIPADNPFVGTKEARAEIWAYGLRNPWRMSFDRKTGKLWAGDVGQNHVEEIDLITAGGNYGWRECEGHLAMPKLETVCSRKYVAPVFTYLHDGRAKSITGGYVYRGKKLAALSGAYIYADFIDRKIWALNMNEGVHNTELATAELPISSFGEDDAGEIYVVGYSDTEGVVWLLSK